MHSGSGCKQSRVALHIAEGQSLGVGGWVSFYAPCEVHFKYVPGRGCLGSEQRPRYLAAPPPPSLTPIYYNVGQTFSPAPSPPLHGLGYSFIILSIPIITLYKLTFSLSIYTKDSFTHRHPHIVTNNIHISSHTSPEPTKPVGCGSGRKGMWRDNSW